MWSREDLKYRAKEVLRKYYWIAFLVTLVGGILGGNSGGNIPSFNYSFGSSDLRNLPNNWNYNNSFNGLEYGDPNIIPVIMGILFGTAIVSGIVLIAMALGFAWQIFLGGPIDVGMNRYFLEARNGRSEFVNLFYSFRGRRYLGAVKAMAWKLLFTFLWTLLFIIPGIVKGYAYSMIPYIMADNPGMDYKRAMKLSMAMTDGQKLDIFVLDLSFLGWILLGVLACCVGVIFVSPYIAATKAELYVTLRQKAIETGICTPDEVGQQPPELLA